MMKFLLAILLSAPAFAAATATTQWWVRQSGSVNNCGGFDAAISGAGTNYADQDSAQLTLTDLAAAQSSTTVTSATGGFTSAMIGNCVHITAGTNFIQGYYWITGFTDTNTITVDTAPATAGAGSGGTGRVGGAFQDVRNLATAVAAGALPAPPSTTPLVAGNIINIRGSGGDGDPGSDDYDWSAGYWQFYTAGDAANGSIKVIGYNGRPRIGYAGQLFYHGANGGWHYANLRFVAKAATYTAYSVVQGPASGTNLVIDGNGYDILGWRGTNGITHSEIKSSGSAGTAARAAVVLPNGSYASVVGNYIHGWRGGGIYTEAAATAFMVNNIIYDIKGGDGINIAGTSTSSLSLVILNNTIDGGAGDGIEVAAALQSTALVIQNNIISNHAGAGLKVSVGTTALNDRTMRHPWNYNNYHNNGTNYAGVSAGANDTTLDPQYVNRAGGNFAVGTNMKARAVPSVFRGSSTTSYPDLGAVQRQEPASGGGCSATFVK